MLTNCSFWCLVARASQNRYHCVHVAIMVYLCLCTGVCVCCWWVRELQVSNKRFTTLPAHQWATPLLARWERITQRLLSSSVAGTHTLSMDGYWLTSAFSSKRSQRQERRAKYNWLFLGRILTRTEHIPPPVPHSWNARMTSVSIFHCLCAYCGLKIWRTHTLRAEEGECVLFKLYTI